MLRPLRPLSRKLRARGRVSTSGRTQKQMDEGLVKWLNEEVWINKHG